MKRSSKIFLVFAILACVLSSNASAAVSEKRLALVIGNASYKAQPLATAVNDAALISRTLQLAGFDVTGARDLDQGLLRDALRNFTTKIANAGAGAVVVVYFAGYGVQLAGDNYLIPVGAEISNAADISARGLSVSALAHAISALNPKSAFIVLDAGRPGPFAVAGQAGGLAWTEPEANMLIAFSTAPGTLARDTAGSYGVYARALSEMIGDGGSTPAKLFDRVRLRVHELTGGGQVPWDASKIEKPFKFFERTPSTEQNDAAARIDKFRVQPMRALGVQTAYMTALLRDTFDAYTDFLADYWQDPATKRIRALLSVRRESITWQRSCQANEAVAYWSYLERYPNGPHAGEAARLLSGMGAATTPPLKFARLNYDVPPPLPDELEYVGGPALILDDPPSRFEAPPPMPADFLERPPQEFIDLKPPAASQGHALPVLDLPLISLRAPSDGKASSIPSSEGDGVGGLKPAIDVPDGQQKQASSFAHPLPPSKSAVGNTNEQSSDNAEATQQQHNTDGALNGNQVSTEGDLSAENEGPSALKATRRASAGVPGWFVDVVTAQPFKATLRSPFVRSETPASAPSMFASASAGLTFQTWRYGLPQPQQRGQTSLQPARPPSSVASSTGLPMRPAASPTSPSQATGSVTPSAHRSAPLMPAATRSPLKPTADQLEPSSMAVAAAPIKKHHRKPPTIKPTPPSQVERDSDGPPHEAAQSDH